LSATAEFLVLSALVCLIYSLAADRMILVLIRIQKYLFNEFLRLRHRGNCSNSAGPSVSLAVFECFDGYQFFTRSCDVMYSHLDEQCRAAQVGQFQQYLRHIMQGRRTIRLSMTRSTFLLTYYAPPLIGGGIKRCFCLTSGVCLSDVCRVHRS